MSLHLNAHKQNTRCNNCLTSNTDQLKHISDSYFRLNPSRKCTVVPAQPSETQPLTTVCPAWKAIDQSKLCGQIKNRDIIFVCYNKEKYLHPLKFCIQKYAEEEWMHIAVFHVVMYRNNCSWELSWVKSNLATLASNLLFQTEIG